LTRLINQYATPRQREVLFLKYLPNTNQELTQYEIAERLGLSQPAISQHLRAGLEAVKRGMLEEQAIGQVNWEEILGEQFSKELLEKNPLLLEKAGG
jgi:DNA-binding transcriptional ArsR family regulator